MFPSPFLRHWQRESPRAPEVPVAYQVVCACGRPVTGQRQRQHQVVPCPSCKKALFILPRSPWPDSHPGAAPVAAPQSRRASWYLPAAAGVAALAVMGGLYLGLRPYLSRQRAQDASEESPIAAIREDMAAGRQALADGNFRTAQRRLANAFALHERHRGLPPPEQRRLIQLHRQADLLANLLSLSLQEVLHQGLRVRDEEEWQAQFADYRGRAVVFDDVVRRDAAGRPVLATCTVAAGTVQARVALEDLGLLRRLPLEEPVRLLFGARLDRCAREEGGVWVIRFQPDSGVLLTDPDIAAACCPAPLDDDLLEVVKRQEKWLNP